MRFESIISGENYKACGGNESVMKLLSFWIYIANATAATNNVADLYKRAKFWNFGKKRTNQLSSESTTMVVNSVVTETPGLPRALPIAVPVPQSQIGNSIIEANVVGSSETIAVAQAVCSEKLIGVVLNGKYKIERVVGKGGFSVVFAGRYNGAMFAIKCLTDTNDPTINEEIAIMEKPP